jgi:tRNA (mo5U34)-methyltransferase
MTTTTDLQRRVDAIPYWYHRIELPDGVVTPGWAPLNAPSYRIPDDLSGKRVLDVGAWDGYWTFEALRRGAAEAVAIDDFSDFLGKPQKVQRRAWDSFDLCREALGYGEDRCRRIEMTVYDVAEADLGRFDVVFFFGALYHLRHPLLALDRLSAVCNDAIYVESAILDDYSPLRGGLGSGYSGDQMVAEFYSGQQLGNNETNWWMPTLLTMVHMVHAAGFEHVEGWKLVETPTEVPHCRGFARASKSEPPQNGARSA